MNDIIPGLVFAISLPCDGVSAADTKGVDSPVQLVCS